MSNSATADFDWRCKPRRGDPTLARLDPRTNEACLPGGGSCSTSPWRGEVGREAAGWGDSRAASEAPRLRHRCHPTPDHLRWQRALFHPLPSGEGEDNPRSIIPTCKKYRCFIRCRSGRARWTTTKKEGGRHGLWSHGVVLAVGSSNSDHHPAGAVLAPLTAGVARAERHGDGIPGPSNPDVSANAP